MKITSGPVFVQLAGWRGATKENTPSGSSTEEQRSQAANCAKTLPPSLKLRRTGRAAGLLSVACVGSFLTARFGNARNSPPWPRPKSPAAGPLVIFKQALRYHVASRRHRGVCLCNGSLGNASIHPLFNEPPNRSWVPSAGLDNETRLESIPHQPAIPLQTEAMAAPDNVIPKKCGDPQRTLQQVLDRHQPPEPARAVGWT